VAGDEVKFYSTRLVRRALGARWWQRPRSGGVASRARWASTAIGWSTDHRPLCRDRDRRTSTSHLLRAGRLGARPPVPAHRRRGHTAVSPPDERCGAAGRLAHDRVRLALARQEPAAGRRVPKWRLDTDRYVACIDAVTRGLG
jgi:hypothetical protein